MPESEELNTEVPTSKTRKSRRRPGWRVLTGVAVVVVAVGLVVAIRGTSDRANAHTANGPQPAANHVQDLTQGWTFYNHTDRTLQYQFAESIGNGALEDGGPPAGTMIPPGGTLHFEQTFFLFDTTTVRLHFSVPYHEYQYFTFDLTIDGVNQASASAPLDYPGFLVLSVDSDHRALNVNLA